MITPHPVHSQPHSRCNTSQKGGLRIRSPRTEDGKSAQQVIAWGTPLVNQSLPPEAWLSHSHMSNSNVVQRSLDA